MQGSQWFKDEVYVHEAKLKSFIRSAYPTVEVDDVVQESYVRVWQARAVQPVQSAKAFLYKVAKHLALDSLRHLRRSPLVAVPDLAALGVIAEGPNSAEIAATREEIALLAEALDSLPPRCREIILLRKFQHLPQKEVAERLGITEGTVQEQVYRGIRRMEEFFIKRGVIRPWQND